jgi:hypothetical protein
MQPPTLRDASVRALKVALGDGIGIPEGEVVFLGQLGSDVALGAGTLETREDGFLFGASESIASCGVLAPEDASPIACHQSWASLG